QGTVCVFDSAGNRISTSTVAPCPATVTCLTVPHITITKEVACFLPGNNCGTFGPTATGTKNSACPAFCWKITIVNSDPQIPVGSSTISDPHFTSAGLAISPSDFGPFPINPGESRTHTYSPDTLCQDTVNPVTATPFTGANATGTAGPAVNASAQAFVK